MMMRLFNKGHNMTIPLKGLRDIAVEIAGGCATSWAARACASRFGFDQKTAEQVVLACCLAHTAFAPAHSFLIRRLSLQQDRTWKAGMNKISSAMIQGAQPLSAATTAWLVASKLGCSTSWSSCCAIGSVALYAKGVIVVALDNILPKA